MKKKGVYLAVLLMLLLGTATNTVAARYRITEIVHPLNTLPFGPLCGINNTGVVAGYYWDSTTGYYHAYRWSKGVMTLLAPLAGTHDSMATGINNLGQIVGYVDYNIACLWEANAVTPTPLGTLGGELSWAYGINDLSQVVGGAKLSNGQQHAFLWKNDEMKDLGGFMAQAKSINMTRQVVGKSGHAFLWENDVMYPLEPLDVIGSEANDINDAGLVVGWAHNTEIKRRPYIWNNLAPSDLGTLGGTEGMAYSINKVGQVVGESLNASDSWRATLWEKGAIIDLNTQVPPNPHITLNQAGVINDVGQIVCFGRDTSKPSNSQFCAYLLTPAAGATVPAINLWLLD
jgi:probable HAF family extracellular repeat protein